MAHTSNSRRFYIDHADDQPIVRRVPVHSVSPATHQIGSQPGAPVHATADRTTPQEHASPERALVRTARRHTSSRPSPSIQSAMHHGAGVPDGRT